MTDFPTTTDELEQYISDYMDAHIAERVTTITDEAIARAVKAYMEDYGAALEDNGANGEVPLVADDYFTRNSGEHMNDTSVPMAANSAGVPVSYFQARLRAFALAAASLVNASDVATPIVEQTETDITINPNVMNIWSTAVASLQVTFAAGTAGRVAHYMMQFMAGDSFTLALPSGIRWMNDDEPEWVTGSTYQVSIESGLAIFAEFPSNI
jgi:hypothetical protein